MPVGLALAWLTSQTSMSPLGKLLWNFAQNISFLSHYSPWSNLWVSLRPLSRLFLIYPGFFQTMIYVAICKTGLTYQQFFAISVLAFVPLTEIGFSFLLYHVFTLSSFCIFMGVFPSLSWFWLLVGSLVCAGEGVFMFSSETKLGMPEPLKIYTWI